jgi:transposase-like protein
MKKRYTPQQKAHIVLEMLKEEKTVAQLAAEHGLHPNQLYKWKAQVLDRLPDLFDDAHKTEKVLKAEHEQQLQALYAEVGRLSTHLAWLKKKSGLEPPTS